MAGVFRPTLHIEDRAVVQVTVGVEAIKVALDVDLAGAAGAKGLIGVRGTRLQGRDILTQPRNGCQALQT